MVGIRGTVRRIAATGLRSGRLRTAAIAIAACTALLGLAGCERQQAAVLAEPLRIPINLKCTTCNDFIRCTPAGALGMPGQAQGSAPTGLLTLRLEEMGFWDQAGTIFLYMFQYIRPWTEGERPLTVYREDGASRSIEGGMVAQLDTRTAVVTTPLGLIDQRSGRWSAPDGAVLGQCESMPRREGFRLVRQFLGRPLPEAGR
jgi:hypothetical protein